MVKRQTISVIVLCWLLCFVCLPGVSWLSCGSSSRCRGFVCSLWLWYFLIILTYYFTTLYSSILVRSGCAWLCWPCVGQVRIQWVHWHCWIFANFGSEHVSDAVLQMDNGFFMLADVKATTQQAHNRKTTSYQRRYDVVLTPCVDMTFFYVLLDKNIVLHKAYILARIRDFGTYMYRIVEKRRPMAYAARRHKVWIWMKTPTKM